MAISLPDARQLPDQVLAALRLRALRGCAMGFPQADVAQLLGVWPETVSRWWTAYLTSGPDARSARAVPSTTNKPAASSTSSTTRAPRILGIACPLWSRHAVRDLIAKEFGIRMPVRTVGK